MFGLVWVLVVWIWPSWRAWFLGLAGYLFGSFALHAIIVLRPSYPWPPDLGDWLRWIGGPAPYFVAAGSLAALIIWARKHRAQS